ncbi:MAG: porin [Polyangiaceae bacterium]
MTLEASGASVADVRTFPSKRVYAAAIPAALVLTTAATSYGQTPPSDKKTDGGSTALEVPETPPLPPTPGANAPTITGAPAPLPKAFPDEVPIALRDGVTGEPIAGWHGMFFLRSTDGNFRISPVGDLMLDFGAWAGSNVDTHPTSSGGSGLAPRFSVRRMRIGFQGDFLKRWSFAAAFDLTQSLTNPNGTEEVSAAPPGEDPTSDSARFKPAQGVDAATGLRDVWVNYSLCPCFNIMVGQFQPPMTMENRTSDTSTPLMERSVATRSFIVPGQRETGIMLWGDVLDEVFTYEVAVVGGDGQNRASVDFLPDVIGRFMFEPLKSFKSVKNFRIGVSARHGERDPEAVAYDVVPLSTSQGFTLWNSTYKDSFNRIVHIIPSGAQNTIGGELYLPVGPVDLAAQGYYSDYHTREAIDGYQKSNTERLGTLNGMGFTAWLTWWAFGHSRIGSPVGMSRPSKLALKKEAELKRGLEVSALFSAVVANYDGNDRGGDDDTKTPGSTEAPETSINTYQFGLALSYWHTRSVRLSFNYGLYWVPDAHIGENLARVPGNLGATPDTEFSGDILHEFGTRVQLQL